MCNVRTDVSCSMTQVKTCQHSIAQPAADVQLGQHLKTDPFPASTQPDSNLLHQRKLKQPDEAGNVS